MTELHELTAREAVAQLRNVALSPSELIDAALERIEEASSTRFRLCAPTGLGNTSRGWNILIHTTHHAGTCTGCP